MAKRIVIAELELDTKAIQRDSELLIKQITKLKEEQKSLKKETGNLSNATGKQARKFAETDATLKKLSGQYNSNKRILAENQTGIKNLNNTLSQEITTINQARKNNKQLLSVRNQVNVQTKAGRDALAEINKKIDENNKFIKQNVSGLEQQKIGIGNYEQGVINALSKVNIFGVNLGGLTKKGIEYRNGLKTQTAIQNASTKSLSLGSKALKIFRLALISTGIGAIVVAFGSLIAFLLSTQRGMDAVTRVTKPISVIFQRLFGIVQDLGGSLFDAFSNPKQAVLDLWKTIKTNLINRVIGLVDVFKFAGKAIKSYLSFDIEEGNEALKNLGESVLQVVTGVEDLPAKVGEIADKVVGFVKESIDIGGGLSQIAIDIEKAEADLVLTRAKSLDQIKEQELIAKDTTKTAEERNKAVDEALRLSKELASEEKNLLNLKIKEEKIKQSLNDSDRKDLKALNELKAEAIAKDTEQKKTELRFLGTKNTIAKEGIKKVIDNANRELQIFKDNHQSKLDANTFFTEELLNQETARLDAIEKKEKEFHKKRLENGVINQQQYNDAIKEVEKETQVAKDEAQVVRDEAKKEKEVIDLENQRAIDEENFLTKFEIQSQRLEAQRKQELAKAKGTGADIEIIKTKYNEKEQKLEDQKQQSVRTGYANTFGQISKLLGEGSAVGKTFAIAQATIQGYNAVLNAYTTAQKSPITLLNPAYPLIQAGIAGAFGAVQVAKISGVKLEKGGLQQVGGKRHSQGGTKFIGEDGTQFEAEQGELIGVMNRNASKLFMDFNDKHSDGGVVSRPNVFANGGLIQKQFINTNNSNTSLKIDYDLLASKIAEANRELPNPIVIVEDINEAQENIAEVINRASR